MSFSAPQSKMPSPARTPRVSTDEGRPNASASKRVNKPPGIINLGMTCFLNSTFQALSATPAIISLLSNNPALPLVPAPGCALPPPAQAPHATPCLSPDALEPPLYQLLPVTRAFTNSLYKAWTTKERGGGTAGAGESSSLHCITLSQLLREMARKYDQYDAFAQQDAHELLRHLLDSMEMEEKDVVKRKAPAGGSKPVTPKPTAATLSPDPATLPLLPPTAPAANATGARPVSPALSTATLGGDERMLPFVDLLFGGLLASVVVCDTCKSVSHTYEGFLDLSLSMRGDDTSPPVRKRDKFRAMASRLKPAGRHGPKAGSVADGVGIMSEPEGSDTEHGRNGHGHGHGPGHGHGLGHNAHGHGSSDLETDVGGSTASLSRTSSSAKGLKASFSFRRKTKVPSGTPASSSTTSIPVPAISAPVSPLLTPQTLDKEPLLPASASTPAVASTAPPQPPAAPPPHSPHLHFHQAAPTPAQAAYIARILYGPPAAPEAIDPLAKLRAAHAGGLSNTPKVQEYGLIESLRAFTAVETLEGDNAFACHKCWKIKNGHYRKQNGGESSPVSTRPSALMLPSIAVEESEADQPAGQAGGAEMSRLGRLMSRGKGGVARANSPLRQLLETSPKSQPRPLSQSFDDIVRIDTSASTDSTATTASGATTGTTASTATAGTAETAMAIGSLPSTATGESFATASSKGSDPAEEEEESSDGLSDSTDDEELPSGSARFFRPPMGRRRPSKHFILRRAFKRYMIAKAPEVLVFHIKRFKQTNSGVYSTFSSLKKLDDMVTFPEMLDLAPFMAPNRTDFKAVRTPEGGMHAPYMDWTSPERPPESAPMPYKLYAVVVHMGTMLSGHYIAYVLVDPEKMFLPPGETEPREPPADGHEEKDVPKKDRRVWCYCSDTSVRLASIEEVLSARAYLCFYEKV